MTYGSTISGFNREPRLIIYNDGKATQYYGGNDIHNLRDLVGKLNINPNADVQIKDDGIYVYWGGAVHKYLREITYPPTHNPKKVQIRDEDGPNPVLSEMEKFLKGFGTSVQTVSLPDNKLRQQIWAATYIDLLDQVGVAGLAMDVADSVVAHFDKLFTKKTTI